MSLLVTIVTGGLAQVPIFPIRWPLAATIMIVLSQDFGHIDTSDRRGALRPRAAKAAIATIPIAPTFLVVPARSLNLDWLGTMRRHGLCLVRAERKEALVSGIILSRF